MSKKEHNLKIIAYCIINNHTYMLINVAKKESYGNYIQKINNNEYF